MKKAREIWEIVRQTYSKVRDAAHIYEIKAKIGATKQGIFSVTKYNNIMKSLWSKLDYYQNIKIKCNKDVAMMFKVLGKESTFPKERFLHYKSRNVMFDTPMIEDSTLVTMKPNSMLSNNNYRGSEVFRSLVNKDGLWCIYCKEPRHTKETCWKLQGKPQLLGKKQMEMDTYTLKRGVVKPIIVQSRLLMI